MSDELSWDPPGPGDWWLIREHIPYAVSRMYASIFPRATLGWKAGGARYGLPTGEPRWGCVNGWIYYGPPIPLTADELAERDVVAARTLERATWRDEVRRWHEEERPAVIDANRALQAEEPATLDDDELAAHLRRAIDNYWRWAPLHFEHSGFDMVGGLLFTAAAEWGLEPELVTTLLSGASPATSEVDRHVQRIADALDAAGAPAPVNTLDEMRQAGPEVAAALDAYLDDYGWRPLAGSDLCDPTVGEQPALVAASINARRARPGNTTGTAQRIDEARARVPADDRARFDELLADARASYALRDDDVGVCFNWPLGLVRRAGLEAGRRLAEARRLEQPQHVFETDVDEAFELLHGRGPSSAELADRWALRERAAAVEPPGHLSGGGEPEPSVELPPNVARLDAIRNAVWTAAPQRRAAGPLEGVGIGDESAVGVARLVRDPSEIGLLDEGDVLVAVATTTAFNAAFPLLSAVVVEQGGLFSHTAILARELALPAVVGVAGALDAINDGDVVEVDPVAGAVRVVDPVS
jgi:pyruvate,water dikinase